MSMNLPYRRSPDQGAAEIHHHPVVVVGAGPVGLALAIDLALRGRAVVVLDDKSRIGLGSRAICWAKRTLEIFDRLGVAGAMMDRGVTWNTGKVYHGERVLYAFDLAPEGDSCFPAFINLQQDLVEEILVRRAATLDAIDLRWGHRLATLHQTPDRVTLDIETEEGQYQISCDYLVAADGVRSTVRKELGLAFTGQVFEDRFLIADVKMDAGFTAERRFWFDPPFNRGRSALIHAQADQVWRIDLQLGRDADPELERRPERVLPRLRAMLGPDQPFELVWVSVYGFQCRRLERFRQGRVLFAGDAAHQVTPFGARGGNSGIQDSDNLAWKLALVLEGEAPSRLLDSYDAERGPAADENLRHSTRTTNFLAPHRPAALAARDAVLALAAHHPFARAFINSGRLSTPYHYTDSPLNTADRDDFTVPGPGAPCADAPLAAGWLLAKLQGGFQGLLFAESEPSPEPA